VKPSQFGKWGEEKKKETSNALPRKLVPLLPEKGIPVTADNGLKKIQTDIPRCSLKALK